MLSFVKSLIWCVFLRSYFVAKKLGLVFIIAFFISSFLLSVIIFFSLYYHIAILLAFQLLSDFRDFLIHFIECWRGRIFTSPNRLERIHNLETRSRVDPQSHPWAWPPVTSPAAAAPSRHSGSAYNPSLLIISSFLSLLFSLFLSPSPFPFLDLKKNIYFFCFDSLFRHSSPPPSSAHFPLSFVFIFALTALIISCLHF